MLRCVYDDNPSTRECDLHRYGDSLVHNYITGRLTIYLIYIGDGHGCSSGLGQWRRRSLNDMLQ